MLSRIPAGAGAAGACGPTAGEVDLVAGRGVRRLAGADRGLEATGDGTAVRPTFSAGNVSGRITALCIAFDDLANFQLTIRETLAEFLDAENFPAGNPDADPTQESISIWYFDQKTGEDDQVVEWGWPARGRRQRSRRPADDHVVPLVHDRRLPGPDCGYTGPYYDIDDNPTDDPTKDQCAGLYRSCNKR